MSESSHAATATLAGGCFWCLEAVFEQMHGVQKVVSGYANGSLPNPSYQQVCSGGTGHAEVVQITYDPAIVTFDDLLNVFFAIHDPTTLNRQGADIGTQYRSAIFIHSSEQREQAEGKVAELSSAGIWDRPIVTQIEPLRQFYPAEEYHQGYFQANPVQPYCAAVVSPKVQKFRQKFSHLLKRTS